MTGEYLLSLHKIEMTCYILIKVVLLLKYFLFVKFRTIEWRALPHLFSYQCDQFQRFGEL